MRATGTFEVKMTPQAAETGVGDPSIGRFALDKQFHGDLEAVSKGQMISTRTAIDTSAGYVAMERVSGTLSGRQGEFSLQHFGLMNRGESQLTITIIPDSASGQLSGLSGTMTISVEDGKHTYVLDYTLP